ncbi:hypothetical protein EDB80DRAFT_92563 [Ilyonectria destructans]|nr:hypothetical protein EDB80DRAFT_92563 [Ilyonectria destructans]
MQKDASPDKTTCRFFRKVDSSAVAVAGFKAEAKNRLGRRHLHSLALSHSLLRPSAGHCRDAGDAPMRRCSHVKRRWDMHSRPFCPASHDQPCPAICRLFSTTYSEVKVACFLSVRQRRGLAACHLIPQTGIFLFSFFFLRSFLFASVGHCLHIFCSRRLASPLALALALLPRPLPRGFSNVSSTFSHVLPLRLRAAVLVPSTCRSHRKHPGYDLDYCCLLLLLNPITYIPLGLCSYVHCSFVTGSPTWTPRHSA